MPTLRLATLLAALSCALPAFAQVNRNVSLNWVRAPDANGCTSAKSVAQRVQGYFDSELLLNEERFQFVSSGSAHVAIEALVTPYQDGWQVAIGMSRGDARVPGTDFVQRSRSCEDLEVQAAVVISQLLDSPGFAHEPSSAHGAAPVVAAVYVFDVEPMASLPVSEPRRSPPRVDVRPGERAEVRMMLGGAVDRGVFEGSGLGARVGAGFQPRGLFPIELHLGLSASDGAGQFPDDRAGVAPGASASFYATKLTLLGCPANWRASRFGIAGCAGLAGHAVNTQLRGFRSNDAAWVSWLGLEVGVRPSFELSSALGVWLEAGAGFTLFDSPDFVAEFSESEPDRLHLYSAPRQTAQLVLGLSYVL